MSYPIEIRLAAKTGWHTPAEAKAYYGRYARNGVTVHWWNTPNLVADSDHDNIVNYILSKASKGTGSVNYVLSNNKITMLVNPDNVAWASQSGNPTTVSVEFSPHLNDEGYKKAGWLINELFNPVDGRYRIAPRLWKHSDWFQTACPGTLDLNRMLVEAAKWAKGSYDPAPTPPPVVTPPPATPANTFSLWKDGGTYVANKQPTFLYDLTNTKDWNTIAKLKEFNKGDLIQIAGSVHNNYIDRDYYITKYSFDNKRATGFHPADLDIYAPPVVVPPTPPEPEKPTDPVEPTDSEPTPDPPTIPVEPPQEEIPNWFIRIVTSFIEWISGIIKK